MSEDEPTEIESYATRRDIERDIKDPKFMAAIDALRRTGMRSFQVRYSDDEMPLIWIAVGEWRVGADGLPAKDGKQTAYESAAAGDPVQAVMRLLDQMIDGGQCTHCGRPTAVSDQWQTTPPLTEVVCWQIYDPSTKKFVRSCD